MGHLLALVATGVVAAGLLTLEFALTRLYSYTYVVTAPFAIVAFAATGAGCGALLAHRLAWLPSRRAAVATFGAVSAALLTVLSLAALTGLSSLNSGLLNALFAYFCFAAAGVALAATYVGRPQLSALVFACQLGGGAAAALAAPWVMTELGPINASLAASGTFGVAALLYGLSWLTQRPWQRSVSAVVDAYDEGASPLNRWLAAAGAAALVIIAPAIGFGLLAFNAGSGVLDLQPGAIGSDKSLFASVRNPELAETVVFTHWDAHGRTDVTEPSMSVENKWLYLDGVATGLIYQGGASGAAADNLRREIGYLPFALPGSHNRVLVIGAGGGQDVIMAQLAGAQEIVVAEPNAGNIAALRRFDSFSGRVLAQPNVRIVPVNGRDFLRASGEKFDLIYLGQVGTGTAQLAGVMTGSLLYTREAFEDYVAHLSDDGRLVVRSRSQQEFVRAFNTAFQAMTRRGEAPVEALRRLLAVNNELAAQRTGGGITLPLLTVRKVPYTEAEAQPLFAALSQSPYPPLYMPFQEQLTPLSILAVEDQGPAALERSLPFDVRPATDSSPFFFEFGKGIPWTLLIMPTFATALLGGVAFLTRRPSGDDIDAIPDEVSTFLDDEVPWRFIGFAALVAFGFAHLQLPLAHRLALITGDAVDAVVVSFAAFLLAGAVSAALSAMVRPAGLRPAIGWACLAGGLFAIALIEVLPMAATAVLRQPALSRQFVAAALAASLGACAGIPFPATVRLLVSGGRGWWAPVLYAVTALAAACGGFVALAAGMTWSFSVSWGLGAVCLLAAFMIVGLHRLTLEDTEIAPLPSPEVTAKFQRPASAPSE